MAKVSKTEKKVTSNLVGEELQTDVTANAKDSSKTNKLSVAMKHLSNLPADELNALFDKAGIFHKSFASNVPDGAHAKNLASVKQGYKEDIEAVFGSVELSEEAKTKIVSLFEAAVDAQVVLVKTELEEQAEQALNDEIVKIEEKIQTQVADYLDFCGKKYLSENQIAMEQNLMVENCLAFIESMREVFIKHAIDIPEDKADVVEVLLAKNKELEEKLNETVKETIELSTILNNAKKSELVSKVTEGLSLVQAEGLKTLAEGLEYEGDDDAFTNRLLYLKKNSLKTKTFDTGIVTETVENSEDVKEVPANMKNLADAISRIAKR